VVTIVFMALEAVEVVVGFVGGREVVRETFVREVVPVILLWSWLLKRRGRSVVAVRRSSWRRLESSNSRKMVLAWDQNWASSRSEYEAESKRRRALIARTGLENRSSTRTWIIAVNRVWTPEYQRNFSRSCRRNSSNMEAITPAAALQISASCGP
jgi:hypothetical protein